jgi:DNA repair exonuclease SbcCD ATPase subunit
LNEIDHLEQELGALRQRFAQSAEVLEDLSQIKEKFQTLSDSYQALQGSIDQAKAFLEASPTESRLAQVEAQMDVRYEQLQAQLTNLRFDFEATTRQLREDADRNLTMPRSTSPSDVKQGPLGSIEEDNRIKWIESSLQHLNTSVYADRSMLQKLDRRVSTLKRTIDIIAVAGFVVFMFLFALVIFK